MNSVRPDFIIDLQFRPEIAHEMILESCIPEYRIAEIAKRRAGSGRWADRIHRDLHANRRLDIEITPTLAERYGRLRNEHVV